MRRLLDGCCGAGGAARGYARAGFEVHGVDNNLRLKNDYLQSGAVSFRCADILDVLADLDYVRQFDVISVSPPCQGYSTMVNCRPGLAQRYPRLIAPVRELLRAAHVPYIIENVSGARCWLRNPVVLCGTMFSRRVYRHRLFESGGGVWLAAPPPDPAPVVVGKQLQPNRDCGWVHPVPAARAGHWEPGRYVSVSGHERRGPVNEAMDIHWMRNRDDVAEAIPPYFTEFLARQVLEQLS